MKITLTMDEETAGILMDAAEFYGRVVCGQYEEIPQAVEKVQSAKIRRAEGDDAWHAKFHGLMDRRDAAIKALLPLKMAQFPELDGMYHHYGLGYSRETDIAYNIYQAVRYALAWYRNPEGGIGVQFDKPSAGELPYPSVDIDGKRYLGGNIQESSTTDRETEGADA